MICFDVKYVELNLLFLQGRKVHAFYKRTMMYRVQRDLPIREWRIENGEWLRILR